MKYYQLLQIEKRLRSPEEKLKDLEFYVIAFSKLFNIDLEKVKQMDFMVIKDKVIEFRRNYE